MDEDDDRQVIVCTPTSEPKLPGAIVLTSDCCQSSVWLSRDGQRFIREHFRSLIICLPCSLKLHQGAEISIVPGAVDSVAERANVSPEHARATIELGMRLFYPRRKKPEQ